MFKIDIYIYIYYLFIYLFIVGMATFTWNLAVGLSVSVRSNRWGHTKVVRLLRRVGALMTEYAVANPHAFRTRCF